MERRFDIFCKHPNSMVINRIHNQTIYFNVARVSVVTYLADI